MTINEEQELKILKIFVDNNISKFSSMQFPDAITKHLGTGATALVGNMIRDGFVADLHTHEYEFTPAGHNRYKLLKRQRNREKINAIAFWIIFVCTLVAAVDVIWKHAFPESTPKIPTKSGIKWLPATDTEGQKLRPDSLIPLKGR